MLGILKIDCSGAITITQKIVMAGLLSRKKNEKTTISQKY